MPSLSPNGRSLGRHVLVSFVVALLLGCGGGSPVERPKEARVEDVVPSAASSVASSAGPARSEGDFSGRGVAGGYQVQSAPAAPPSAPPTSDAAAQAGPPVTNPTSSAAAEVAPTSMIIRTGDASIEVDSLERAIAQVRAVVQRVGGFVANTSLTTGRDQLRAATLELKVPAPKFDEVVSGLSPIGHVETVNVRAEDVGEEYVDVAAREANARRLEARLVALLESRTGKLSDVLEVERELSRVRGEIERMDGRMRFLRTRAAMSTLSVTVHEPPPIVARPMGASPIAEAFRDAWRNFVGLVAWLIAASGVLIPLGALAAAGWWATRGLRRQHREARVPAAPSVPPSAGTSEP